MRIPPSPEEQALILLTGQAHTFSKDYFGRSELNGTEYQTLFTVSRADVHAFVGKNGVPGGAWSDRPGSLDGLYMTQVGDVTEVYVQERGVRFDAGLGSQFTSRSEAEAALTDYLLAMSGTGLFPATWSALGERKPRSSWLARVFAVLRGKKIEV